MSETRGTVVSKQTRLQLWLGVEERAKPKVYTQVFESARILSLNYWLGIVFSAGIATFGLVMNSPAVIIGAMLISPLMGPIMASGLALAVGDLYLAIKVIATIMASIAAAIALSAFAVWLLPFHSATAEIIARTNPTLLDLGVAVFSGLAGSVVLCRGGGEGGVTALPGVAIAVALMPPLCTMGFGLGSGGNWEIMEGAGLLFLTNLVAIARSAFLTFWLVGMGSPGVRAEIERVQEQDQFGQSLARGPLGRVFSPGAPVRWRIVVLAVLLGSVSVPLRQGLEQVAGEAVARSTVQSVVQSLAPSNSLVSRRVDIGREAITIRLISTKDIPAARIKEAEQSIAARTGRPVELTVQEVASKRELADLVAHLSAPAVAPPPPVNNTLEEIRKETLARITPVITAVWPPEAPLQSFDVAFDATGIVCNVKYQSDQALGPLPLSMIVRDLREKLNTPGISLNATRIPGSGKP